MIDMIISYLSNRTVHYNDQSSKITAGVPQGGILSPFLFNITLDLLLNELTSPELNITAFADDLTVQFSCSPNPQTISSQSSKIINQIKSLSSQIGLQLAQEKCSLMISYPRSIKIDDPIIPLVSTTKILGFLINNRLSLTSHLKFISEKSLKTIHSILPLARISYGISSDVRRLIYNSVISPQILYCPTILSLLLNKSCTKKLLSIHRRFACIILKSFRSAPTNIILPLSKMPNITYRLASLNNKMIKKYPTLGSIISVPDEFPPIEEWNPLLQKIFSSSDDIHSNFPSNPDFRLVHAITGHSFLNSFMSKLKDINPNCPHCSIHKETPYHILFYCPAYRSIRARTLLVSSL